jgi:diguanylate cyclase (GGDEF)-like protein
MSRAGWSKRAQPGLGKLGMPGLGGDTPLSLPLFALLLLVVIWGATLHFIDQQRDAAVRAVNASLGELLDTYEAQVARNLGAIEQTLKTVAYAVKLHGTEHAIGALQQEDLLPSGLIFAVSIADASGRIVARNPPTGADTVRAQAYFAHHLGSPSEAPFVSESIHPTEREAWQLHFTRRLNDADGGFVGVAIVDVDPAYFATGYERSRQGELGMLALFGETGDVLAMRVGERQFAAIATPLPASGSGHAAPSPWDGVWRFSATRALPRLRLNVVVGLAEREQLAAFETRRTASLWEAAVISALLLGAVGLYWLWTRQGAKTRRSIRLAQQTYAAASQNNQDAFLVLHSVRDDAGAIVDFQVSEANPQAEKMTGMSRHDLLRQRLSVWMPNCAANGFLHKLAHAATSGGVHEAEIENLLPELHGAWLHEQLVGVEGGVVAIVRDVSARKAAEAKMLHMAQHDTLTGMPNRSLLNFRLARAIAHADRRHSAVLVAFIDLDNFKMVNDGLGNNAGDELLAAIAMRMGQCLRRQDTLGRFGGDEFVLVLPAHRGDLAPCIALLERISAVVCSSVEINGHALQVSCSIGAALYPRDGASADTLLVRADAAMYSAKEAGKNNIRFYTQQMGARDENKLALVEELRGALQDDQLRVVYQPKFEVGTGRMFGVEALLRWQHPLRGMVSPLDFIPLAEESGLIVPIGLWVLETACAQCVAWQDSGDAPITVSVNVSARQFDDPTLLADVARVLRATGLAPARLELEVTESLIMRDLKGAVDKMAQLKAMGIALSIDDFGTGYSSLSALKSFPISSLKIDQSFVRELATNVDDQAIAKAIIALAHQLQLRVIAEGVELQSQFEFLREHGCDEVQGYLFGRPSEPAVIAAALAAQAWLGEPTAR